MTQYTDVYVNISDTQREKLKRAIDAGCATTTLNLKNTDLRGEHKLALTSSQANKLQKAIERGKRVTFRMSKKTIETQSKSRRRIFRSSSGFSGKGITYDSENRFTGIGCRCPFRISINGGDEGYGFGSLPEERRID